jgi:hypothetical protein
MGPTRRGGWAPDGLPQWVFSISTGGTEDYDADLLKNGACRMLTLIHFFNGEVGRLLRLLLGLVLVWYGLFALARSGWAAGPDCRHW